MGMLVISRRRGERVIIALPGGGEAVVTMLDRSRDGRKQRLGIEAPAGVAIFREELRRHFTPPKTTGDASGES